MAEIHAMVSPCTGSGFKTDGQLHTIWHQSKPAATWHWTARLTQRSYGNRRCNSDWSRKRNNLNAIIEINSEPTSAKLWPASDNTASEWIRRPITTRIITNIRLSEIPAQKPCWFSHGQSGCDHGCDDDVNAYVTMPYCEHDEVLLR